MEVVKMTFFDWGHKMKTLFLVGLCLLVAGCAAPDIDSNVINFDQDQYHVDLYDCRGGNLIEATAISVGKAAVGSLWGVVHGASAGALAGDGLEGAAIGAGVGAAIGFGVGAVEAYKAHETELVDCLRDKGYVITGSKSVQL